MKAADPRVKLLWTLLCTTGALLFVRPWWMLGLGLFTLGGALLLGADLPSLVRRLKGLLPVFALLFLVQVLFTANGMLRGMTMAMRLAVLLCAASVMARENSRRVIAALTKMGVPYLFSFLLLTALRFLPFFREAFSDAMTAIQLRGIDPRALPIRKKFRLYGRLVLPVVADAVVKAQNLAIVMEARGFGALPKRTSYLNVAMTAGDWLLTLLLLGIGGLGLGTSFLW